MDASKFADPEKNHPTTINSLAVNLVTPFTQLFITLLDEELHLAGWLTSTVKLAHKGGDEDDCGSCRLVILSSIGMRTSERALCDRTVNYLEGNKLTMVDQHSFGTNVSFLPTC